MAALWKSTVPATRRALSASSARTLRRHGRRRRLLDQLLVAALDAAVPLAQDRQAAVPVAEQLDLDVARGGDQLLEVEGPVAEGGQRLARGRGQRRRSSAAVLDPPHPPPAAAGRGLQQQREADLGEVRRRAIRRVERRPAGRARSARRRRRPRAARPACRRAPPGSRPAGRRRRARPPRPRGRRPRSRTGSRSRGGSPRRPTGAPRPGSASTFRYDSAAGAGPIRSARSASRDVQRIARPRRE